MTPSSAGQRRRARAPCRSDLYPLSSARSGVLHLWWGLGSDHRLPGTVGCSSCLNPHNALSFSFSIRYTRPSLTTAKEAIAPSQTFQVNRSIHFRTELIKYAKHSNPFLFFRNKKENEIHMLSPFCRLTFVNCNINLTKLDTCFSLVCLTDFRRGRNAMFALVVWDDIGPSFTHDAPLHVVQVKVNSAVLDPATTLHAPTLVCSCRTQTKACSAALLFPKYQDVWRPKVQLHVTLHLLVFIHYREQQSHTSGCICKNRTTPIIKAHEILPGLFTYYSWI